MQVTIQGQPYYVAVTSAFRPQNVEKMHKVLGCEATWFVAHGNFKDYHAAGAKACIESGKLTESRNLEMFMAESLKVPLICLDDDVKKYERAVYDGTKGKYVKEPISFFDAVGMLWEGLKNTGAHLAGGAPTNNPFFYHGNPVNQRAFIVANTMMFNDFSIKWDEKAAPKDDYDITLAHIAKWGHVARRDDLLVTYGYGVGKGGANETRTGEIEMAAIKYITYKWPGKIRMNPKRKGNEILLNL